MLRRRTTQLGLLLFLGAVACSDGVSPRLAPCTDAGSHVTLPVVSAYTSLDPATSNGCIVFATNVSADSAEFVVIPQLTTGIPGKTSSYRLAGDTIRPALVGPAYSVTTADLADMPPAERFHAFLRLGDEEHWRGLNPRVEPAMSAARSPAAPAGPPAMGSQRAFKVCAKLNCSTFNSVTATVRALKSNVAIYVDNTAPVGGLDSTQLDSLATMFENRLYPTDTA